MKKGSTRTKKPHFEVKREVIRVLTVEELAGVAGGGPTNGNTETCTCNSTKANTCG